MEVLRNASEAEMVAEFLQGEIGSHRFREDILRALAECGASEELITQSDCSDESANALRARVLGVFRGYPDREIFENYPADVDWKLVRFAEEDLGRLRYISYSYWDELSKGTSRPDEAAKTVNEGVEIFGVSNRYFLEGRGLLLEGKHFPPIIVLTDGNGPCVLIEGHCRATCYALVPGSFAGTEGYVGFCTTEELHRYNPATAE